MVIAALFIIAQIWKQLKYKSTVESINKLCSIHTMEEYSARKKERTTDTHINLNLKSLC